MIRLIPALAAALVAATAFAPVPAAADAAAQVRAMVAEVTGRPVRQVRAATPARSAPIVAMVRTGDAEAMVMRTIGRAAPRGTLNLAPIVSLRPMPRPGNLALAFATSCRSMVSAEAPRVCAQPVADAAPLRFAMDRPAAATAAVSGAATGQSFVITDGQVRHYALTR